MAAPPQAIVSLGHLEADSAKPPKKVERGQRWFGVGARLGSSWKESAARVGESARRMEVKAMRAVKDNIIASFFSSLFLWRLLYFCVERDNRLFMKLW